MSKFIAWRVKKVLEPKLFTKQEEHTEKLRELHDKSLQDTQHNAVTPIFFTAAITMGHKCLLPTVGL